MSRLVLAIDSENTLLDLMEELLVSQGYDMRRGDTHDINIADIQCHQPEFVILEMRPFEHESTITFLTQLRNCMPIRSIPVIVDSTDGRLLETLAKPLHQLGCITLEKPFDLDQFLAAVGQAGYSQGFDWHMEPPAWLTA